MKFQKLTFLLMGILGLGLLPFVSGALMAQTPGFYYTIQKGDTLWDLSQKFNETQWDWPGLWEMNSKVKEPSWIHPGNKIQIFLKNDHSMSMQKVANQLPISPTFAYPLMKYVGFIHKKPIPHLGKVTESQKNQEIISVGDTLYIEPTKKNQLVKGNEYLIFSTQTIRDKLRGVSFKGVQHTIKATIKIIESRQDIAVAKITHAIRPVSPKDMVMAYQKMETQLPVVKSPMELNATLICAENHFEEITNFQLAFIDKGQLDEVKPGQIYTIVQKHRAGHKNFIGSPRPLPTPIEVAKAIVLRAETNSATIMVLSATQSVHPGDKLK